LRIFWYQIYLKPGSNGGERRDGAVVAVGGARDGLEDDRGDGVGAGGVGEDAHVARHRVVLVLADDVLGPLGAAVREEHDDLVAVAALPRLLGLLKAAERLVGELERRRVAGEVALLQLVHGVEQQPLVVTSRLHQRAQARHHPVHVIVELSNKNY
jgi:hypothetical protein